MKLFLLLLIGFMVAFTCAGISLVHLLTGLLAVT